MKLKEILKDNEKFKGYTFSDYPRKKNFAKDISKAFKNLYCTNTSVIDVDFKVFWNKKYNYFDEYIVVTYEGGAIAATINNINSIGFTFNAIGKLVNGGYYDEVKDYLNHLNNENFIEVEL